MIRTYVLSLPVAMLMLGSGSSVIGAVIPAWTTPNNSQVVVPLNGTSPVEISGIISSAFDAMLVFDTSGSMNDNIPSSAPPARNGGRRKRDWALDGADDFIDALPDKARLGLTRFTSSAMLVQPVAELGPPGSMPSHRELLKSSLRGLAFGGDTNIANAITRATQQLTSLPGASDSLHIVLVSDGIANRSSSIAAAVNAVAMGITSINTVALPGSDASALQGIAEAGKGKFVDGRDLTGLVDGFRKILEDAGTLSKLDIELPGGSTIERVDVKPDGRFSVSVMVAQGNNLFRAKATSSLGETRPAELNIIGVVVPEPAVWEMAAPAIALMILWLRRSGHK